MRWSWTGSSPFPLQRVLPAGRFEVVGGQSPAGWLRGGAEGGVGVWPSRWSPYVDRE